MRHWVPSSTGHALLLIGGFVLAGIVIVLGLGGTACSTDGSFELD